MWRSHLTHAIRQHARHHSGCCRTNNTHTDVTAALNQLLTVNTLSLPAAATRPNDLRHASPPVPQRSRSALLVYSEAVKSALAENRAVVALESTILSHGMPYPDNIKVGSEIERVVRANGAEPATIAILNGRIHVGLTDAQLEYVCEAKNVIKTSRRDLAMVTSGKLNGATTVAGTMVIAHEAGIPIFATGGIGGVHHDGQNTMDVSADLTELGRTPTAVVCAGVKSILDIPRTLEYLETQGVPVVTLGPAGVDFPAFFTRSSKAPSPMTLPSTLEVARLIDTQFNLLNMQTGIIVANPIPHEFEADGQLIEEAVQQALAESNSQHVQGKDVTPWILKRVRELTGNKSLEANKHLVYHNAAVASQIASQIASLRRAHSVEQFDTNSGSSFPSASIPEEATSTESVNEFSLVVVGGAVMDIIGRASTASEKAMMYTSVAGSVTECIGGVGFNVTRAAQLAGANPLLVTVVGKDLRGTSLLSRFKEYGLATRGVINQSTHGTGTYSALLDNNGEHVAAVFDGTLFEHLTPQLLENQFFGILSSTQMVCFDGNISTDCMSYIAWACREGGPLAWFEPTSVPKCIAAMPTILRGGVIYASPNQLELDAMADCIPSKMVNKTMVEQFKAAVPEHVHSFIPNITLLSRFIPGLLVKLGPFGVLALHPQTGELRHFAPTPVSHLVNVTGAGDSMVGVTIAGLLHKLDFFDAISTGMDAAALSLQSHDAVPASLAKLRFSKVL